MATRVLRGRRVSLDKPILVAVLVVATVVAFFGALGWYVYYPGALRAAAGVREGDRIEVVGEQFPYPVSYRSDAQGEEFLIRDRVQDMRSFSGELTHWDLRFFDRVVVILRFSGGRVVSKEVIWDDW
jgi:hypothetical protein